MPRATNLNILDYWRTHEVRYPTLARMARDILAIPISTVASESAFSVGGRVLDSYRSSLKPQIVEAIICLRDWIYGDGLFQLIFYIFRTYKLQNYVRVIIWFIIYFYSTNGIAS